MLGNLGARMSELEKEVEELNKAVIRLEKELEDADPYT